MKYAPPTANESFITVKKGSYDFAEPSFTVRKACRDLGPPSITVKIGVGECPKAFVTLKNDGPRV